MWATGCDLILSTWSRCTHGCDLNVLNLNVNDTSRCMRSVLLLRSQILCSLCHMIISHASCRIPILAGHSVVSCDLLTRDLLHTMMENYCWAHGFMPNVDVDLMWRLTKQQQLVLTKPWLRHDHVLKKYHTICVSWLIGWDQHHVLINT